MTQTIDIWLTKIRKYNIACSHLINLKIDERKPKGRQKEKKRITEKESINEKNCTTTYTI
jgi:hypothetical protein